MTSKILHGPEFMELAKTVKDKTGTPMLTTSGGSELVLEMLQSAGASPIVDRRSENRR